MSVKYPLRINITTGNNTEIGFYTASFATSAENFISSSVIVERINNLFRADFKRAPTGSHADFNPANDANYYNGDKPGTTQIGSNTYLSASTETPMTGSITFTDTETATNDGLKFYEFFGSKVCQVLGLPEGIPIYTENFKLSDDASDNTNYLSGQVIADGVTVKESISFAPQSRMKSNIQWDEENGEGLLQWTSGSTPTLRMGYNPDGDKYTIGGAVASDGTAINKFEISGFTHVNGYLKSSGSFSHLRAGITTGGGPTNYFLPFSIRAGFHDTQDTQHFIPMNGQSEATTFNTTSHLFISPFNMKIRRVFASSAGTPGTTIFNMFKIADGTAAPTLGGGGLNEGVAFSAMALNTANTVVSNTWSPRQDGTEPDGLFISKGQKIAFTIDPTNSMSNVSITLAFGVASNYDDNDAPG